MCKYCADHGKGKKWFMNLENYSKKILDDPVARDRNIIMNDHAQYLVEGKWPLSRHTIGMMSSMFGAKILGKGVYDRFWSNWHLGQVISNEEGIDVLNLVGDDVAVIPCLCRKMNKDKDLNSCFALSLFGDLCKTRLDESQFKIVSNETAKEIMTKFEEEEGCYHSVWALKTPFVAYLCNCDDQACQGNKDRLNGFKIMKRGHQISTTDSSKCNGCGDCITACHFNARQMGEDNIPIVSNCFGCGVCRTVCEPGAISLIPRGM